MNKTQFSLQPFFQQDQIDLKIHPDVRICEKLQKHRKTQLDFSMLPEPLKSELKFFIQHASSKDIKGVTLVANYIVPLNHLTDFLRTYNGNVSTLRILSSDTLEDFKTFLLKSDIPTTHPINGKSRYIAVLDRVYKFCLELYGEQDIFQRDIWNLEEIGIENHRNVESNKRKTITFYMIPNLTNKKWLKEYLQHLIKTTDRAISTIYKSSQYIKEFLIFLKGKNLSDYERKDVELFLEYLNNKNLKNETFNEYIFKNNKFIEYLIVKGCLKSNYFHPKDIKNIEQKHKYKSVDEYVIKQIFSVLDKIPFQESCMFLLLYSTGMRVSEVCSIKRDAMFKNENGCFIRFFQQKMRKEVVNPISTSLYKLLIRQHQTVKNKFGNKTIYLFPYYNLDCYPSAKFRERMQKWFKEQNIKNADGSDYVFRPHDYRHTLATTMILNDVPFSVIQKILHHESPEMTVAYIDIQDQKKIERYKEFINIKGEKMPIFIETGMGIDDLAKVEWLKKSINAQILPNGICSLPVAMGKCPHANSCLTCYHFRTSKEFLPIHEKHLKNVCRLIDYAKQKGWQRQVETNEEVKKT